MYDKVEKHSLSKLSAWASNKSKMIILILKAPDIHVLLKGNMSSVQFLQLFFKLLETLISQKEKYIQLW